ncbi:mitochondrial ribonuclease P catalytic subunit [Uranotaenia lowii]|uniref:mitochondrial ribonuclease P catalytic subunit n=1 Tax=Uranotaenia lowii TaxID=190385 RepID=UPI002479062F|nr:mitochondrial ribonuclease P catalytic subunit [Uranotaenia lowii]
MKLRALLNFTFRQSVRSYAGVRQKVPVYRLPQERLSEVKQTLDAYPVPSLDQWNDIRRTVLDERRFTSTNVDSTVLGICNSLESGKSYVQFLNSKGINLNLASKGKLLRLYRSRRTESKGDIDPAEQAEIYDIFQELRQNNPVLDANTCEHLIAALTLTKHWKECFDLIDTIKLVGIPDSGTYSVLVEKCFLTGESELGWRLLDEMVGLKRLPNDDVYLAWVEFSLRESDKLKENIERLLEFTGFKGLFLSKSVGNALKQLPGIQATDSRVTDHGKCPQCRATLASITVSEESFEALRQAFLQAVIIKKDIFNKTTPQELERFQKFLKKTKPYDVVIDGLNVAFSTGNQKSPVVYAKHLAAVVSHYSRQKKRVLVIGRQHMDRWKSKDMKFIRENSFLFLTEDLSQDDPFLLYAALESGPRTDFFSRDLMRKHSFLLGHELGQIFKRWQQEHQYSLTTITPNGRVIIKAPFQYEMFAHRLPEDDKRWHVPLVETCLKIPKIEKQAHWLCLSID